jgi:uncharacterized protein
LEPGRLFLLHTGVPEPSRRQGFAGRLVAAAVARAGDDGLTLVPWCPYARHWLRHHPGTVGAVAVDWATLPPADDRSDDG